MATPLIEIRVIMDIDLSFHGLLKYRLAMNASNPKLAPEHPNYSLSKSVIVGRLSSPHDLLSWPVGVKLIVEESDG